MAQAVFVKITQEKRRFIYITLYARAQTPLALFWRSAMMWLYRWGASDKEKGDGMKTEWTGRNAQGVHVGSIADAGAKGEHRAKNPL